MEKELVHDIILLQQKARKATKADISVAEDLEDTLKAHRETCAGMAANMIGVPVCILSFYDGSCIKTMFNPKILKASEAYEAEEGCLSFLGGPKKTKRYRKIKVQFETKAGEIRIQTFAGFSAEIIQHEMDHFQGILI